MEINNIMISVIIIQLPCHIPLHMWLVLQNKAAYTSTKCELLQHLLRHSVNKLTASLLNSRVAAAGLIRQKRIFAEHLIGWLLVLEKHRPE